jgi:hypothetical protein
MRILDPGRKKSDPGSLIKHPGSATLIRIQTFETYQDPDPGRDGSGRNDRNETGSPTLVKRKNRRLPPNELNGMEKLPVRVYV